MASRLQRPFSEQRTKLIAAGAVLVWLIVYLATFQVAYSYDPYWLLTRDFEVFIIALAGLGVTLLAVFWMSSVSHQDKVMIGVVSLLCFYALSFVGGLYVSCANGNCV